jgi:tetratricopeptide (TPR) repeat protein
MNNKLSDYFFKLLAPVRFAEAYPLLIFICLLILLASAGSWLSMPLSGELKLAQLITDEGSRDVKSLILFSLFFYCLTTAYGFYQLRVFGALGLLFLVIYLALTLSFFNGENIGQYINESQDFRAIQHILALNETPNAGRSVESSLAFDAFKLSERVGVAIGLLGWGAKLAIIGALSLSVYAVFASGSLLLNGLLAAVALSLFLFTSGVGQVSLAYLKLNQGIRDINQNKNVEALSQLNEAAQLDPALSYSVGFPLISSYAYFNIFGPAHNNAFVYQMSQHFEGTEYATVFALGDYHQTLKGTKVSVSDSVSAPLLSMAIERTESELLSHTYNRVGLLHLWRHEWGQAEQLFLTATQINQSFVARMALLRIYFQTKQFSVCNAMADELLAQLTNRSIVADILTTKGDCLSGSGQALAARTAYEASIKLDGDKNYRAVKGLSGT